MAASALFPGSKRRFGSDSVATAAADRLSANFENDSVIEAQILVVASKLFLILVVVVLIPSNRGSPKATVSSPKMVKSLAAFAIFALLGTSVIVLPGFAPTVDASEAAVLAKSDRLAVHKAAVACSMQVWPDFAASCLQNPASQKIVEVRLVTARR